MNEPGPSRVRFSRHAVVRAAQVGRAPTDVADLVLDGHPRRRRNPREADWLVSAAGLVVAYNWPDGDDPTTARVVTLWPQE